MYPTHLGVQPLEAELVWGGGVPAAEAHQQQLLSGQGSLGHLVRTLVWGGRVAENRGEIALS